MFFTIHITMICTNLSQPAWTIFLIQNRLKIKREFLLKLGEDAFCLLRVINCKEVSRFDLSHYGKHMAYNLSYASLSTKLQEKFINLLVLLLTWLFCLLSRMLVCLFYFKFHVAKAFHVFLVNFNDRTQPLLWQWSSINLFFWFNFFLVLDYLIPEATNFFDDCFN